MVSRAERRLAASLAREQNQLMRRGVILATRVLTAGLTEAIRRFRINLDPLPPILKRIDEFTVIITEVMIAAHLSGFLRAKKLAPLRLAFKGTIQFLRRRAELSEAVIERLTTQYSREALRVIPALKGNTEKILRKRILIATQRGLTTREGIKELRKGFRAAGLVPKSDWTVEAVFRTQTQLAYGAGQWDQEQSPEIQEILWGYKYVTVGDDRVRDEHAGFDGVTLPKEDQFWATNYPPNGWACRCQAIAIFEKREIKRPREVNGVTPAVSKGFDFNPGVLFRSIK